MSKVIVYADGGSRGNPGKAGYGAVVLAAGSGEVLAERCEYLGEATNNVAEYRGLIAGLTAAIAVAEGADIIARLDSKLVVEQMSGRWKIKHPDMAALAKQARELVGSRKVTYEWVPRKDNAHADRLANEAMDGEGSADLVADVAQSSGAQSSDVTSGDGQDAAATVAGHPTTVDVLSAAEPLSGCAGQLSPGEAWQVLQADEAAVLVDVRTQAEWTFVGVPLVPHQQQGPAFIEWVRFPSGRPNSEFLDQLQESAPDRNCPVLFICRSGARSASAAIAASEHGYTRAYNVGEGFEGDLSHDRHRNVNGWRKADLPWCQR